MKGVERECARMAFCEIAGFLWGRVLLEARESGVERVVC